MLLLTLDERVKNLLSGNKTTQMGDSTLLNRSTPISAHPGLWGQKDVYLMLNCVLGAIGPFGLRINVTDTVLF